jgi:hypothetical protein
MQQLLEIIESKRQVERFPKTFNLSIAVCLHSTDVTNTCHQGTHFYKRKAAKSRV